MATPRYLTTIAAAVAVVVLAAAGPAAADLDDCAVAQRAFSDCVSYVTGLGASVRPQCCTALGDVRDLGDTAPQRRALCRCILAEMLAAGKVNSTRAKGLPSACKVQVGFIPTGPGFNCAAIP